MSRSAEITLDWADGTYVFAMKWGQLIELQEKSDCGPYVILSRLIDHSWRVEDVSNVIRLGLIGGGMEPVVALKKVRAYVENRPPLENVLTAQAILSAGLVGAPDEPVGKLEGAVKTPKHRSRKVKSELPTSTELVQPSD